jgi:hypothetical protein
MTLSIMALNILMLNIYAECHLIRNYTHYAECHYAEWRYAQCRYAECHYAECRYAECHYGECRYAECHGAKFNIIKYIKIQHFTCCVDM